MLSRRGLHRLQWRVGFSGRIGATLLVVAVTAALAVTASAGGKKTELTTVMIGIAGGINTGSLYWDLMVADSPGSVGKDPQAFGDEPVAHGQGI